MSSSNNRKQKQAAKTAQKALTRKASGRGIDLSRLANIDEVNKAFQQLSQNQARLGELINQNLGAIRGAFDLVDGHQFIMRRILNDIVKGNVRLCPDVSDGVDYSWYVLEYNSCRGALAFFIGLASLAEPMETEKKITTLEERGIAPAGNDFVFGGDYAHQDSP